MSKYLYFEVTPQNLFFDYEIALGGTANVPELV